METVTREQEADHLIQLYGGDAGKVTGRIEGQLAILAGRAQTMLSLAGITITVTGFSGANIARSGKLAAWLIVGGLTFVLAAASLTFVGILRVRWTSQLPPCSLRETTLHALEMRDEKTNAYSRALALLIVGLCMYVASVGLLLVGSANGHP